MGNKDYDEYIVKVRRQSKDGADITEDVPGSGGRRKDDGTLSAQYYDPRPYEPDTEDDYINSNNNPTAPESGTFGVSVSKAAGEAIGTALGNFLWEVTEKVIIPKTKILFRRKIMPGAKKLVNKLFTKGVEPQSANVFTTNSTASALMTPDNIVNSVNVILNDYMNDMSDEEKQRHLINMMIHYMCFIHEMKVLSRVPISQSEWKAAIDILSAPEITSSINKILANNPALIEASQAKSLSLLLGTDIIVEGNYIPIKREKINELLR